MLGVVAERRRVLAAEQAPGSEPRLVGDRDDHPPAADPGELGDGIGRPAEVLEHLEAEHELELGVRERQLVDAGARDVRCGKPPRGERDRLWIDVDGGDPRGKQWPESRQRLALAAPCVEHGARRERLDDRRDSRVEALDQLADHRVRGLILGVVAALRGIGDAADLD